MPRILAALLLLPALAAGCGGHGHAAGSTTRKAPVLLNAGRLVDIGGGRSLYLHCVGSGSPTVVLEAGFGGSSDVWSGVQPQLGRATRTCAYDRAGLGNSLPMHGVHDAGDEIRDLRALLQPARARRPMCSSGIPTAASSCGCSLLRTRDRPTAWCSSTPWAATRTAAPWRCGGRCR